MRYVEIDIATIGPQRVIRLIECENTYEGPQFIDVTGRSGIGAASWYDAQLGEFVDAPPPPTPTPERLTYIERAWRDAELNRSDIELNKVQDGMGVGTVTQWREYRCNLRNWPESQDFPDLSKRPVAPDFQ